jgi:hypothetical protein
MLVRTQGLANTGMEPGPPDLVTSSRAEVPLVLVYARRAAEERVWRLLAIAESTVVEWRASFQMNVRTLERL